MCVDLSSVPHPNSHNCSHREFPAIIQLGPVDPRAGNHSFPLNP